MSAIKVQLSKLNSEAMLGLVPDVSRDVVGAQTRFNDFTRNPQGIYSGYRASVLGLEDWSDVSAHAQKLAERFKTMFVCGIGGSSLGAQSVLEALNDSERDVHFLDNLDTILFDRLVSKQDLSKCCVVVISKTGGTVETMLNACRLMERFHEAKLSFSEHFSAITTEGQGYLWKWAQDHAVKSFGIPEDVGGRYSLLTPVGLLPLCFANIDVAAFIAGAQEEFRAPNDKLWSLVSRLEDFEQARFPVLSFWTYSSVLSGWGRWFQQLWAESLGKIAPNGVGVGTFPLPCIGANDQHSLLQLYIEGSLRAVTGVLTVEKWPKERDWKVRLQEPFDQKLGFTQSKMYSEVLNAEASATAQALAKVGRPCFELSLPSLDAKSLGALYAWSMDLTVASGALKQIHPFNQPGVEVGKLILENSLTSKGHP